MEDVTLQGDYVRLEPMRRDHIDGLVAAAAADPALYKLTSVPQGYQGMTRYVESALAAKEAGMAVPLVTVRQSDGVVLGSSRFWLLERWAWPQGHPRHGSAFPDACEMGHTWLGKAGLRTAANTEAKLLMMTHAFEHWKCLRVCFHADMRNERSRAALERIGAKFEGTLRAHRMAADFIARDSARYSIVAEEWPEVKARLQQMLARRAA